MKKLLTICLLLIFCNMATAQNEVRRCTEQEIPMSARHEYVNQAKLFLQTYYNQLLLNVNELMIQEAFIRANMNKDNTQYKPEFMLTWDENSDFLTPDQYMMQLDKQFRNYDLDNLNIEISNITVDERDFFLPNLISCYIIAEYDLTLSYDGEQLYKRHCRAYCFFPRVSVSIMIQLMQVEPVRDIVAYSPQHKSVTNPSVTRQDLTDTDDLEAEWRRGNDFYDRKEYDRSFEIYSRLAEKGYAKGYNALGVSYYRGNGVKKDDTKAFSLYLKAAEGGYVRGMTNVASSYFEGLGVTKNDKQAFEWYKKAAELGDSVGQDNMGFCYMNGVGVKTDRETAFKWYKKAAEQGYAYSEGMVALCYERGMGIEKNLKEAENYYLRAVKDDVPYIRYLYAEFLYNLNRYNEAFPWYEKAAERNYPDAITSLGLFYEYGNVVKEDHKKALEYYLKGASMDSYYGCWKAGTMYENGKGTAKDVKKAVEYYKRAAEHSNTYAQVDLAKCYLNGIGIAKSEEQAFYWYSKAAELGYYLGYANLGYCYEYGKGTPINYKAAMENYYKAATEGQNSYSMHHIGNLYYKGKGVKQDYNEARMWYEKAAELNYSDAEYELGCMYLDGVGVEINEKIALKWFERAAGHGDVDACVNIGYIYSKGRGVQINNQKGYEWYKKAADKGNAVGQHNLGVYYENGIYVAKDVEKARYWYEKAAKQGYENSKTALESLNATKNTSLKITSSKPKKKTVNVGVCTGYVKSWDKKKKIWDAVVGASIMIKGTQIGVISDFYGKFTLPQAKKGDTLEVCYVGYKTVQKVWNGGIMEIYLEED